MKRGERRESPPINPTAYLSWSEDDSVRQVPPLAIPPMVALTVALALSLFFAFTGYDAGKIAAVLTVGLALCFAIAFSFFVEDQQMEPVKQIGVWLGIVTGLPLVVWYGTNVFSPPPDWKQFSRSETKIENQVREAENKEAKEKLREEKDRLQSELDAAEAAYYRSMFWVAYPIGIVAVVVGIFFPVQVVGAGLIFGGLSSLTAGCYSYWDRMDGGLRFGSLLVALVVFLALGTVRFRSATPRTALGS